MTEKRSIAVRIRGREFKIRSDEPGEQLASIARKVDETMERVEKRTGAVDSYDVAMLTALNLAREVVTRGAEQQGVDAQRLRSLIELAESALVPESA